VYAKLRKYRIVELKVEANVLSCGTYTRFIVGHGNTCASATNICVSTLAYPKVGTAKIGLSNATNGNQKKGRE
jgi:hypothetical protein